MEPLEGNWRVSARRRKAVTKHAPIGRDSMHADDRRRQDPDGLGPPPFHDQGGVAEIRAIESRYAGEDIGELMGLLFRPADGRSIGGTLDWHAVGVEWLANLLGTRMVFRTAAGGLRFTRRGLDMSRLLDLYAGLDRSFLRRLRERDESERPQTRGSHSPPGGSSSSDCSSRGTRGCQRAHGPADGGTERRSWPRQHARAHRPERCGHRPARRPPSTETNR